MVKIPVEISRGKKDQGLHGEETIVPVSKELQSGLEDRSSLYLCLKGLGHQMNIFFVKAYTIKEYFLHMPKWLCKF
jgi:hypothetical protein